jgi:hypothetical protein
MMYAYIIMSHRTQIILTDEQYSTLKRESERSGLGLAELVRRALVATYGNIDRENPREALAASFGAWRDRTFDGEAYLDALRRGMAQRLSVLDKIRVIERVASEIESDLAAQSGGESRSLLGLLKDLGPAPSAEEIDAARHEE